MNDRLLTIIVPAFNMERYLCPCLDSVLAGPFSASSFELIVVNDGSKDKTGIIAHDYARRFPGILRVLDKPNGNYGSCINAALPLASGRYVKILDADDSFDPAVFVRYLSFLQQLPERNPPDVLVNDFVEVDSSGNITCRREFGSPDQTSFSLSEMAPLEGRTLWMHSIAYRRALFENRNYRQIEGISYTDQQWVCEPLLFAKSFCRFPEPLYRYLKGRPGQTVDPAVRLRNFGQHIPVQRTIVEALLRNKPLLTTDVERFVRELVLAHLSWIYREYLVEHACCLEESEIRDFDLFLEDADEALFRDTDGLFFSFDRLRIKFHYVREWRRKRSRRTAKFRCFDALMHLRRAWRRVKSHTGATCFIGRPKAESNPTPESNGTHAPLPITSFRTPHENRACQSPPLRG